MPPRSPARHPSTAPTPATPLSVHALPVLAALLAAVVACEPDRALTGTALGDSTGRGALRADLTSETAIGAPLPFLSFEQRLAFDRGSGVFLRVFTPATGLGPLFNGSSCAECHEAPVVGGAGDEVETHATAFHGLGVCDELTAQGGPVVQDSVTPALRVARGIDKEPAPAGATAVGRRTSNSILGLGLLDAVPDWEILALADPNDRNYDGISGRVNRAADGRIGRFGRKAQVSSLGAFVATAFVEEMGITSPAEPAERSIGGEPIPAGVDATPDPELPQDDLTAAQTFVQLLAPPRPEPLTFGAVAGSLVFAKLGCSSCHVPALLTGYNRVSALSFKAVYAYTDLLLHDMGPELADICLAQASPSEFRTAPLMGLRFREAFLHDGRAKTIEESILLHGGEGGRSRDRFAGLAPLERWALLKYLSGL